MRKKTIKQVNTKKIHILKKYSKTINILKLSQNKKGQIYLIKVENPKKFELEYEY